MDGARSVIAVPVIDRDGLTHGGIALGHQSAHYYSDDDVALLTSLGRLAMMTIENEQLLRTAEERAQELDIIFEHIGDAISLLDARGNTKRENRAARQLRQAMMFGEWPEDEDKAYDDASAATAVRTRDVVRATPVALMDRQGVAREYEVRHATLVAPSRPALDGEPIMEAEPVITGAVVVHHDVTETRRLIEERQARGTSRCSCIRRVVKNMQATTGDHTTTFQPPEGYLVAAIDARRIEQMLANLIGNAIKYSPEADHVEVTLRARGEGEARLNVADYGIGIPREQHALLFGRFARADNARERRIEGNGLGLYLCREVVEGHHGRIWFDSAPGQGTTCHVTLPMWREG